MSTMLIFYVKDQVKSKLFYESVLGKSPSLDVPGMTEFELENNTSLGLMPEDGIKRLLGDKLPHPNQGNGIPRAELYIHVDDPNSYHSRAVESGATELTPLKNMNWGDKVAYSMDIDGHVLAFAKRIKEE